VCDTDSLVIWWGRWVDSKAKRSSTFERRFSLEETKLLEMVNDVLHTPNKAQSTHEYDTRKDTDPNKVIEAGQTPSTE
jgi:hypothetical protein